MAFMDQTPRPAHVTDEVLKYLDDLRETGCLNMFGAAPYLEQDFDFDRGQAKTALLYWMETFGERHPRPGRPSERGAIT